MNLCHRYVCTGRNIVYIWGLILSVVSGIFWGPQNMSPVDRETPVASSPCILPTYPQGQYFW